MSDRLDAWLQRLEQRGGSVMRLGLERVRQVAARLALDFSGTPVITVGGTNGKGSVVGYLETLYGAAGYNAFAYTSPHLLDFCERIRIGAIQCDTARVAEALDRVEAVRGESPLTYFEHVTLAALVIAGDARPDLLLLEVGLGGRLDAVNIIDPDVAVITSIGLDHLEWLGPDRAAVAREKAGIARMGRPLVVGDCAPPDSLHETAAERGARCLLAGRDFRWWSESDQWNLQAPDGRLLEALPMPAMSGTHQLGNAACAWVAADALRQRLPFDAADFHSCLAATRLPGRFQSVGGRPEIVFDVGHNGHAAEALAGTLETRNPTGSVRVVLGMLADKDENAVVRALDRHVHAWYCATLGGDRGRTGQSLAMALRNAGVIGRVEAVESVTEAVRMACRDARPQDLVLVSGSFATVAEAMAVAGSGTAAGEPFAQWQQQDRI